MMGYFKYISKSYERYSTTNDRLPMIGVVAIGAFLFYVVVGIIIAIRWMY